MSNFLIHYKSSFVFFPLFFHDKFVILNQIVLRIIYHMKNVNITYYVLFFLISSYIHYIRFIIFNMNHYYILFYVDKE